MIPILLFFGLCFFGLGDCQDDKISESVFDESYIQVNNTEITWDSSLPLNYTESYSCVWQDGKKHTMEECKEQSIIASFTQKVEDCTENEKLSSVKSLFGFKTIYIDQCIPLSNEEIIIKQNNEILALQKELIALHSTADGSRK